MKSLHKALSRKVFKSGNWYRAKRALSRQYRKVARQRENWQWKLSDRLCTEYDMIVMETLNIDGMKRLWGRKVSDVAFYQFIQLLEQNVPNTMNFSFWFVRFWRIPSETETVERFSSKTPIAMPLMCSTRSGRLVCSPSRVTSSAMPKSLLCGFSQSMSRTVMCCSPVAG